MVRLRLYFLLRAVVPFTHLPRVRLRLIFIFWICFAWIFRQSFRWFQHFPRGL